MAEVQAAISFASGMSTLGSTAEAVDQVVDALGRRLPGQVDLVLVFATPHHREHLDVLHRRLRMRLQPRVLLGCVGEGVVGVQQEIEGGAGLSVLAASLPGATLHPFHDAHIHQAGALASPTALREAILGAPAAHGPDRLPPTTDASTDDAPAEPRDDLRAVLLLADPFSTPLVKLLPTLNAALPGVPVIGGMASGAKEPGENRLMLDDAIRREGAVGVAIGGDIDVRPTVSQGCRPIGRPLVITRAQRHVVRELGGRNALAVVQEMVQQLDAGDQQLIQQQGLLVGRVINEYKPHFGRGDFLIRGLVGVDPKAGYLAIGDPQVRVGQTVQFHVRDQRTATEDLAMLLSVQKLHGPASGALMISCNSRGTRLFDRRHADAMQVHEALGDVPMAGFFAAGELGPVQGRSFVHSHSVSLAVFRPRPAAETVPTPGSQETDA